jgi:NitT/TauT family transport system permease protein
MLSRKNLPKLFWGLVFLAFLALLGVIYDKASAYSETRLLPYYAVRTLLRLSVTYIICLAFGLGVGILAATKEKVGNLIIPLLDILQSVPVLGFFPLALAVIIHAFHSSGFGLELASMFLLFTSMEWSIVFGVIAGIKSMPSYLKDMSRVFHIEGWDYLKHILFPSIYPHVIAGSILAWGSGWYFVIVTEFINYGGKTYSLPGLGYYLQTASFRYGSVWMSLAGLATIGIIVFFMNRLIWHRLNERAKEHRFLLFHGFTPRQSTTQGFWARQVNYINSRLDAVQGVHLPSWFLLRFRIRRLNYLLVGLALLAIIVAIFYGWIRLPVTSLDLEHLARDAGYSMSRLAIAYFISLALAIAVGYLILQQPGTKNAIVIFTDVAQSIPALAYFPLLWLIFTRIFPVQIGLEIAAVLLMLTGMLWYLIFNVIEAVEHWPKEIKDLSGLFNIKGARYLRHMLIPALFPALVTGSILAWGGGWNATIVSEYVNIGNTVHTIPGLGSALDEASGAGNNHQLVVLLIAMSAIVIVMNSLIWRRLLSRASAHVLEEE